MLYDVVVIQSSRMNSRMHGKYDVPRSSRLFPDPTLPQTRVSSPMGKSRDNSESANGVWFSEYEECGQVTVAEERDIREGVES